MGRVRVTAGREDGGGGGRGENGGGGTREYVGRGTREKGKGGKEVNGEGMKEEQGTEVGGGSVTRLSHAMLESCNAQVMQRRLRNPLEPRDARVMQWKEGGIEEENGTRDEGRGTQESGGGGREGKGRGRGRGRRRDD